MRKSLRFSVASMMLLAALAAGVIWAGEHEDGHDGGKGRHRRAEARSPAYEAACGGCHFAYPACLLPAASWRLILDGAGNHYGNAVSVEEGVRRHLLEGAADESGGKRSAKIMRSLGARTPERVTEAPYLLHKHRDLTPEVFARPSVGGMGDCPARHPDAAAGRFGDDLARVPAP